MPYEIRKAGNEFCVYKKDGAKVGCHASEDKAKAQMRALYANESIDGAEGEIKQRVQEVLPAFEAVWTDNADGPPQADVVIIRPGESLNGRIYSKEAIEDAVNRDFWGNTPMFADHGDKAMPRKRSIMHLKARIEPQTSYVGQEGEARARVSFIDRAFAGFMKDAGPAAGLSAVHEFLGQRFKGNDGRRKERVDKFLVNHSVDFVAFPAAGGEVAQFLTASEGEEDMTDWNALSEEMLAEHRPDILEAHKAKVLAAVEAESGDDNGDDAGDESKEPQQPKGTIALEAVERYIDEKIEQVNAEHRERERKQIETRGKVTALVAKSGLPSMAQASVTGIFDGQESFDEEAVQAAIDGKAKELKEAGWRGPTVRGLGDSSAQKPDDAPTDPAIVKPWLAAESQLDYVPRVSKDDQQGKVN